MMDKLYILIQDYRRNNTEIFLDIVKIFEPLLNKYQRYSSYEDIKSDLIVFMFKLLDKIPLENDVFKKDKYIISYIHRSLRNQYIFLNKMNSKMINKEIYLKEISLKSDYKDSYSDIFFRDMISGLTELEQDILIKIYMLSYSEADIARLHSISRQAVNKTHKRALDKLRKIYYFK